MNPRPLVLFCAAASLAACGPREEGAAAPAAAQSGWAAPPRVEQVAIADGEIRLSGRAAPGARVVMKDGAEEAHAATAEADGAFLLSLPAPTQAVLLRPEVQDGERAVPGPDVVLVLADGGALALSPGAPSRRLDAGSGLAAVDSDGRLAIVSGRVGRGQGPVRVRLSDGREMEVAVDAQGVWTLRADLAAVAGGLTVDSREYRPRIASAAPGSVAADPEGTLVGWQAPDGATLSTWTPTR